MQQKCSFLLCMKRDSIFMKYNINQMAVDEGNSAAFRDWS